MKPIYKISIAVFITSFFVVAILFFKKPAIFKTLQKNIDFPFTENFVDKNILKINSAEWDQVKNLWRDLNKAYIFFQEKCLLLKYNYFFGLQSCLHNLKEKSELNCSQGIVNIENVENSFEKFKEQSNQYFNEQTNENNLFKKLIDQNIFSEVEIEALLELFSLRESAILYGEYPGEYSGEHSILTRIAMPPPSPLDNFRKFKLKNIEQRIAELENLKKDNLLSGDEYNLLLEQITNDIYTSILLNYLHNISYTSFVNDYLQQSMPKHEQDIYFLVNLVKSCNLILLPEEKNDSFNQRKEQCYLNIITKIKNKPDNSEKVKEILQKINELQKNEEHFKKIIRTLNYANNQ
jgi:hypothetical protein